MPNPLDLEALREIFKDRRTYCVVGKVMETELASDRSVLFAKCSVLTQDERPVVAKVCWDAIGPNAGSFSFPQPDDLVLLEFAEGDNEQCFLTRRLSSRVDCIPRQAATGDMVHRALTGKTLHLLSDDRINLGAGGIIAPDEPLVLGNVMIEALTNILGQFTQLLDDIKTGPIAISSAPGQPAPTHPTIIAACVSIKAEIADIQSTYLDTESSNIVSQLAFTEREGS